MSRTRALVLLLSGLMLLSGCVQIPTSGPAVRIEGQAPPCQDCVNVEVAPPSSGDEPTQIVAGYLRATSNYQPNYSVAKQYLTQSAAETWSPEDGAQIYTGTPAASGKNGVVLNGQLEGSLGSDRTFTALNRPFKVDFGVVKEDGEWRISRPPPGLMIAEYSFSRFYTSYNIYFVGNQATLVPDPIYLPILPQANVASVLMRSLLAGPSTWLKPAVTSFVPVNTAITLDSVTVLNGVAQVPLSDAVLPLNDRQRSLLTAQVVYTLKQAVGVDSVLFTVNQKPFRVPDSDENTFEVSTDQISTDVAPVPFVAGDQLYGVSGKAVKLVESNATAANPRPMAGDLGEGKYAVNSLAISVANTDIAVVTDNRTVLRAGLTTTGDPEVRLSGVTNLMRPQYSRYAELWAVGDQGGRQRMWMFFRGRQVEVGAPILAGGRITAFRISPDGTRMALVRTVGGKSQLGLARISRSDTVTVDGWRTLDTTVANTAPIASIQDVGWLDATNLMVLGATSTDGSMLPYRISEDASVIMPPSEPGNADARELTILLGAQTSVIIGKSGKTFKYDGAQWLPFVDGFSTMAFPG